MNATASFATERASRYLSALCHHFGRKVEATCADDQGWVQFPFGRCAMQARPNQLHLTATADDAVQLDHVMQIINSHLDRFAFRENPQLAWDVAKDNGVS